MESVEQLVAVIKTTIMRHPHVVFAYLFGSVVKGTAHGNSDVDVAVYYSPEANDATGNSDTVDRQIELGLELERVLKRPVDVVVLNRVSIDLRQNVLAHGRLLMCIDHRALTEFKLSHLHRYQDFMMLEPIFRRYRLRRIKEGRFGGRSFNGSEAPGHH